jgi:predicted SAM-dependent methyltransferase
MLKTGIQPNKGRLRLNIGCGLLTHPSWVNVDGSWNARLAKHPRLRNSLASLNILPADKAEVPWSRDIFVHDIRKPLPFHDCSADAVYASHVLEHLYREQGQHLILESFRVLASAGIVRIVVPDLHAIVREYLGDRPFGEVSPFHRGLLPGELLNERLLMRWPSPSKRNLLMKIYETWQDFHYHKWMYDEQSLASLLNSVGFVDVVRRNYAESLITDITDIEDPSRILNGAGVCVEGLKP